MARLIWTEPDLSDLQDVADYLGLDNPPAARRYVQKVFTAAERLKRLSRSERQPVELTGTPYRLIVAYIMRYEQLLRAYVLAERADEDQD